MAAKDAPEQCLAVPSSIIVIEPEEEESGAQSVEDFRRILSACRALASEPAPNFESALASRKNFYIIGDSNLRDTYNMMRNDDRLRSYNARFDFRGGRGAAHLAGLFSRCEGYKFIIILVGNNDVARFGFERMIDFYRLFIDAFPSTTIVKVLQLLQRKDQRSDYIDENGNVTTIVKAFNRKLKPALGDNYYPNFKVYPCHFNDNDPAHLLPVGRQMFFEQILHMMFSMTKQLFSRGI